MDERESTVCRVGSCACGSVLADHSLIVDSLRSQGKPRLGCFFIWFLRFGGVSHKSLHLVLIRVSSLIRSVYCAFQFSNREVSFITSFLYNTVHPSFTCSHYSCPSFVWSYSSLTYPQGGLPEWLVEAVETSPAERRDPDGWRIFTDESGLF